MKYSHYFKISAKSKSNFVVKKQTDETQCTNESEVEMEEEEIIRSKSSDSKQEKI